MKFPNKIGVVAALALTGMTATIPATATAQSRQSEYQRRQETKNEWRNIAIGSGALAIIGLLADEPTLTFAGTAGALYSAYRYEQDRKSQNRLARTRAEYFSKPYFVRDGVRYDRKVKYVSGKKYYYFAKAPGKSGAKKNVPKGKAYGWYKKG